MVEIPKNSVNLKEELKAETEEEDQIKPKKLGTISLSTAFSSEDSDSEVEVKNRKKSNKLVEDSSSSEDSDSEDSDSEDSEPDMDLVNEYYKSNPKAGPAQKFVCNDSIGKNDTLEESEENEITEKSIHEKKKIEPIHQKKKLEYKEQNESKERSESTEQNETIEQNDSIDQNDTLEDSKENKITENDVGKMKKNQCAHCFETYHKGSIWRHSKLCELYQKFTINGSECSVCLKIFKSRKELNGHIGRKHEKELNELTKTKGM